MTVLLTGEDQAIGRQVALGVVTLFEQSAFGSRTPRRCASASLRTPSAWKGSSAPRASQGTSKQK